MLSSGVFRVRSGREWEGEGGLFKIINDATDSGVISVTYNGVGKTGGTASVTTLDTYIN